MRVTVLTIGSRGDAQPFMALGLGLKEAGHTVRLATHETFQQLATSRGLDFFPIRVNPQQILEDDLGKAWLESGRNPFSFIGQLAELSRPVIDQMLRDSWKACEGAEAIIYSTLGLAGYHVAEKMGIPSLAATLQPMTPTAEFPSIWVPPAWHFGGTFNELTGILTEQLFWQAFRKTINERRRDMLGLHPLGFFGPYRDLTAKRYPVLCAYSRHVVPKPKDWGEWIHVTGYWFLDRLPEWQPPAALVDFLAAGPAPIYIGFGSMTARDPAELTDLALRALKSAGRRGVLLKGWAGLGKSDMPEDVYLVESVPHDWLFPQMSAVVHHGGAGTTAAGLRAGKPSIITPLFGDQPFWGDRVFHLGAGPKPVRQRELTVDRLAAAIRQTEKEETRQAAAHLGELIRAEDGVANAVAAFNRHAATD
jgi:sterol 3beta-glucosyltransferase